MLSLTRMPKYGLSDLKGNFIKLASYPKLDFYIKTYFCCQIWQDSVNFAINTFQEILIVEADSDFFIKKSNYN